jgi:hypothetical protein
MMYNICSRWERRRRRVLSVMQTPEWLKLIGEKLFCGEIFRGNIDKFLYRDAGIREAECERTAMDVKYSTDTKIEDNSRMYKLQKANFDQEVNTAVSLKLFPQIISNLQHQFFIITES